MHKSQGLTFVELLLVVFIAMIVMTMGVPSFQSLIENFEQRNTRSTLYSHLTFARSQAVKLNTDVTICPVDSSNSNTCSNDWENLPITLFIDDASNSALSATDDLLKQMDPMASKGSLAVKQGNSGSVNRIVFSPDGLASSNADFTYCSQAGNSKFGIKLALSGRSRMMTESEEASISCTQ